ncbi:MAG: AbrB family transcriptional regulator [Pseudomonadota bacterium]
MLITLRTLAIGFLGAGIATYAGFPAGPLLGSAVAVAIVALGLKSVTSAVDDRVRNVAFLVVGISIGSGFDGKLLGALGAWGISLVGMCLSLTATMLVTSLMLQRICNFDRGTAVLASAPGTISLAIALGVEGRGNVDQILVVQTMRLFLLTSLVPLGLSALGGPPLEAVAPSPTIPLPPLLALIAAAAGIGFLVFRSKLPAAHLIAGMVVSALAHITGVIKGVPPDWLIFMAFAVTGTVVGTRLARLDFRDVKQLLKASALTLTVAIGISIAFAAVVASITPFELGEVWIAFAPGGVEVMAAIGFALGYDPAFTAIHHIFRISFLAVVLPILAARATKAPL